MKFNSLSKRYAFKSKKRVTRSAIGGKALSMSKAMLDTYLKAFPEGAGMNELVAYINETGGYLFPITSIVIDS